MTTIAKKQSVDSPKNEALLSEDSVAAVKWTTPMGVFLADIDKELRPARQMRAELIAEAVENFKSDFKDLPPVRLMWDAKAKTHWVVDGRHRIEAARRLKLEEIRTFVSNGSLLDAWRLATQAVTDAGTRGWPYTNADKHARVDSVIKMAAEGLLKDWPWTERKLAEFCGVSHTFIQKRKDIKVATVATSSRTDRRGGMQQPRKAKAAANIDSPRAVPHSEIQSADDGRNPKHRGNGQAMETETTAKTAEPTREDAALLSRSTTRWLAIRDYLDKSIRPLTPQEQEQFLTALLKWCVERLEERAVPLESTGVMRVGK
jgi:hypothetical protein